MNTSINTWLYKAKTAPYLFMCTYTFPLHMLKKNNITKLIIKMNYVTL